MNAALVEVLFVIAVVIAVVIYQYVVRPAQQRAKLARDREEHEAMMFWTQLHILGLDDYDDEREELAFRTRLVLRQIECETCSL